MAATSSGRPIRRTGVNASWCSTPSPRRPLLSWRRSIGVSMNPGGMVFTVIPFGPSSRASDLVKPMTPALAAT
jgi:hypothetical protein